MKNLLRLLNILNRGLFIIVSIVLAVAPLYNNFSFLENILGVSAIYLFVIIFNIVLDNCLISWQQMELKNKFFFERRHKVRAKGSFWTEQERARRTALS